MKAWISKPLFKIDISLKWKISRINPVMFLFKVPLTQEVTEVIEATEKTKINRSNKKMKLSKNKPRNHKKKSLHQEKEEATECLTI